MEKKVSDSRTEQTHILMYGDLNGYKRLFGGRLVEWIDVVAGVVARRHCEMNITTVAIDNLHFKAPAYGNELLVLLGQMTHVGRTSMEVRVDTFVEHLNGKRDLVNRAYLVMVALGDDEKPTEVPRLIAETDEEKLEMKNAEKRIAIRKAQAAMEDAL